MINFLRKLRLKEIKKSGFIRYLMYAVGEILLIVIGIIIAININNKNDSAKNEKSISGIFDTILTDLENDIKESNNLKLSFEYKDSISLLILENKLVKQDYIDNPNLFFLLGSYAPFTIDDKGYQNLQPFIGALPSKYTNLVDDLNNLYLREKPLITDLNNELKNFTLKTLSEWSDKYNWFLDIMSNNFSNDEAIDYFLNEPKYKNKVALYKSLNSNNALMQLKAFLANSKSLYRQIHKLNYPNKEMPVFAQSQKFQLNPEDIPMYTGTYVSEIISVNILNEDDIMYAQVAGQQALEILAIDATNFYSEVVEFSLEFLEPNNDNGFTKIRIIQNGMTLDLNKS